MSDFDKHNELRRDQTDTSVEDDPGLLRIFGERYLAVKHNRNAQMKLLWSSNPFDRLLSLSLLRKERTLPIEVKEMIHRIATYKVATYSSDEREIAWLIMSNLYDSSHDVEICKLAAEAVLDASNNDEVRLSAYAALLYMTDRAFDTRVPVSFLEFPSDIDWDLVRNYAKN